MRCLTMVLTTYSWAPTLGISQTTMFGGATRSRRGSGRQQLTRYNHRPTTCCVMYCQQSLAVFGVL